MKKEVIYQAYFYPRLLLEQWTKKVNGVIYETSLFKKINADDGTIVDQLDIFEDFSFDLGTIEDDYLREFYLKTFKILAPIKGDFLFNNIERFEIIREWTVTNRSKTQGNLTTFEVPRYDNAKNYYDLLNIVKFFVLQSFLLLKNDLPKINHIFPELNILESETFTFGLINLCLTYEFFKLENNTILEFIANACNRFEMSKERFNKIFESIKTMFDLLVGTKDVDPEIYFIQHNYLPLSSRPIDFYKFEFPPKNVVTYWLMHIQITPGVTLVLRTIIDNRDKEIHGAKLKKLPKAILTINNKFIQTLILFNVRTNIFYVDEDFIEKVEPLFTYWLKEKRASYRNQNVKFINLMIKDRYFEKAIWEYDRLLNPPVYKKIKLFSKEQRFIKKQKKLFNQDQKTSQPIA